MKQGNKVSANFDIDLPGHRKLCGCNDCYWYRRGHTTSEAKKILEKDRSLKGWSDVILKRE